MMRHNTHATIVFVVLSLMLSTADAAPVSRALAVSGDAGFGGVGGKAFTTIQTGLDIREGNLSLGLFGRVRILSQEADDEDAVRRRDWDEPSDFVHLLRYLSYRHDFKKVSVEAQVGEMLGITLGHGTLVRDYSNIADPDHPHAGLRFKISHDMFEVVGMVDNLIRPSVLAARVGVRPLPFLERFGVGASFVTDPMAPIQIRRDAAGRREVDSAWNLQSETEPLLLLGLDASYRFGDSKTGQIEPYVDLNTSFLGVGVHAGALGRVPLGKTGATLSFQVEYRGGSGGYAPGHVDTFYDVARHQAGLTFDDPRSAGVAHRAPMLAGLARKAYGGHGVLVQSGLALKKLGRLKLGYTHRPGPDENTVWVRLSTQPIPRLNLGTLVLLRGLGGPHDDANGVVAMAEGRFRITDNVYALAQYSRSWSLDEDRRFFGIMQSFNFSVGANWSK